MRIPLLAIVLAATSAASPAQPPDAIDRLRAAIERAVADNPDVASMEARIEASKQRISQSTALPDPEIEIGIKDIPLPSFSLSQDPHTMEMVALRQRFPGFGKLGAEERFAQAQWRGERAEHVRHVVEIAAEVADSFFHLAEIDRRIVILDETHGHLSDAVTSSRERYRVGKAAQADVLRADLEKTALDDRHASLQAARRSEAARFNALQNLPAESFLAPVGALPGSESPMTARPVPPLPDLLREAQEQSPSIAASASRVEAAEEGLRMAKLEHRPDWMLAGNYGHRVSFDDMVSLSVSISLPWAHPRRLEARRLERQAQLESARADLAAVRNGLRREIDQAYAQLEKNREQVRLYRDSVLPQAEINYRAAREAYGVGSIDFLTYVRAATDLDMYQEELAERESGVGRALAMLQRASGLVLIAGTPAGEDAHAKK